jgi:hypothetical protein
MSKQPKHPLTRPWKAPEPVPTEDTHLAVDYASTGVYDVVANQGDAREHFVTIDGRRLEHVGFHKNLWAYR